MSDDRRRDAPEEPTTGQRVAREVANFSTDSTVSAPGATPELVAAGLAQIEAERAAESNRRHEELFDPFGTTLDHATGPQAIGSNALAGGTLDLPASDQVASAGDLDPGQVIGHFVIRSRLGEGGMGMVLAGHDADLGRPVAIKVVKDSADHPAYRERLLREARVMARLEHPNVVRVYEVGSDRGRLFVAMELVDGVTLMTWLAVQRRTWRETLAMFRQVGLGLAAVHRAGLVHRDFKPDNVLVDRDGRARVADFGLARLDPERATASPELAASLTRTGMMVGTPAYMAPEQHFGGNVDARADQYSFCVSLREALIGSRPIKIEDAHWGKVPRAVRVAITRGASVDLNERFATMDELLDALARGASRRTLYLGATMAAVVLVGGVIGAIAVNASLSNTDGDSVQIADTVGSTAAPSPTSPSPSQTSQASASPPPSPASQTPASPPPSPASQAPASPPPSPASQAPASPPPTERSVAKPADTRVAEVDKPRGAATSAKTPASGSQGSPASSTTIAVGGTVITPMTPVKETDAAKQHNVEGDKPPRHEMPAAHRAAVRDALRDFGFLGVTITGNDRDADLRELEAQLAAATDDLQRGMILYGMGQAERSRDDCIAAAKHWRDAKKLVLAATKGPIDAAQEKRRNLGFLFYSRSVVGEAYCELTNGRALGVDEKLVNASRSMWSANDAERAEVWFAMGIAMWETGDEEQGARLLVQAAQRGGSAKLRGAIDAYANAVGVKF